ncbi:hypothetical protein ABIA54_001680 [Pseudomonas sp. EB276 TE3739]|uniref:hypothetical protein n=1 Tax=Pseudomonas TaxID=286 RepID=UPI0020A06454|nr:hypothetical protein [Pseudomonas koreensis]MCP1474233.1 hypothetical protein [Pseudomonas koreensis]
MADNWLILVVGASILVLPETDELEVYDDLVDSTLLAQLVANKKVEKSPGLNWYDAYVGVLDDFWLRQQKSSQTWTVSNETEETSLDFFTTALTRGALGHTRTMTNVLARMAKMAGEEPAIQLLRNCMTIAETGQAITAPASSMDVRLLVTCANSPSSITTSHVQFKTREALTSNPLQQVYQPDDVRGVVQANHARATLSETLYRSARKAIALKVRDRRASSVARLTLPEEIES